MGSILELRRDDLHTVDAKYWYLCQFLKRGVGGGGISLLKVGKDVRQAQDFSNKPNSRAKFSWTLDCKSHKISVQVILSIPGYPSESVSLCKPSIYDNSHGICPYTVIRIPKWYLCACERLTMTTPRQFCFAHVLVYDAPIRFLLPRVLTMIPGYDIILWYN